ncbi:hypothetical protein [Luteimonas abyssi]|uniref:hypothetical protein n=1 Tax=Luteimonas abyssi TaxID=1247514 RepID=UPI000737AF8E|nr:hypothetical protein [Luteimonas abyssi]
MRMFARAVLSSCLVFGVAACTPSAPSQDAAEPAAPAPAPAADTAGAPAPPAMPGADRDAHGCIGSAGYSWCERTAQCERPWELAEREGFDNDADAYAAWCGVAPD